MKSAYLPEQGDIVWLTFDPRVGREQSGRRPAVVLSPRTYNSKSGLALVCPVTNQKKGYPFEVALPDGSGVSGVILADHIKSVDWNVRLAERISKCPPETMEEIRAKVLPLSGS